MRWMLQGLPDHIEMMRRNVPTPVPTACGPHAASTRTNSKPKLQGSRGIAMLQNATDLGTESLCDPHVTRAPAASQGVQLRRRAGPLAPPSWRHSPSLAQPNPDHRATHAVRPANQAWIRHDGRPTRVTSGLQPRRDRALGGVPTYKCPPVPSIDVRKWM